MREGVLFLIHSSRCLSYNTINQREKSDDITLLQERHRKHYLENIILLISYKERQRMNIILGEIITT